MERHQLAQAQADQHPQGSQQAAEANNHSSVPQSKVPNHHTGIRHNGPTNLNERKQAKPRALIQKYGTGGNV
jgi:hypothetical protein